MKRTYDYTELIEKINKIRIVMEGDEVVTYNDQREVSRKQVSKIYEIFDFRPFVKKCIDQITEMYEISEYELILTGGRQEIKLYSSKIDVNGEEFQKTFFLLNSSDKSRALSLSYGLSHKIFKFVSSNGAIYKKHYKGITDFVEEKVDLDDSVFNQIIESIRDIMGNHIKMSNIQKIITESEVLSESKVSFKNKFKSFCGSLSRYYRDEIDRKHWSSLWWGNFDYTTQREKDFNVDAFHAFEAYLAVFRTKDALIIKRESDRILKLTTEVIRDDSISQLLDELDAEEIS